MSARPGRLGPRAARASPVLRYSELAYAAKTRAMNPGGPNANTHAGHFPGTVARTDLAHARSARTRKKARRAAAYRSAATTAPAQEEPSRCAATRTGIHRTRAYPRGSESRRRRWPAAAKRSAPRMYAKLYARVPSRTRSTETCSRAQAGNCPVTRFRTRRRRNSTRTATTRSRAAVGTRLSDHAACWGRRVSNARDLLDLLRRHADGSAVRLDEYPQ